MNKYDIVVNRSPIHEEHHRKTSSFIEMMPDFEGNILNCQGYLTKLKTNNDKIQDLKEKHNKTVAPNKEKGTFTAFLSLKSRFLIEISKNLTKILKENEGINGTIKEILNKLTTDVEISKKESPVKEKISIFRVFCVFFIRKKWLFLQEKNGFFYKKKIAFF